MGSRLYKHHGRKSRNQRQKQQRIMNIVTLIFIVCVGVLILGAYGVLPLPQFILSSPVIASSGWDKTAVIEDKELENGQFLEQNFLQQDEDTEINDVANQGEIDETTGAEVDAMISDEMQDEIQNEMASRVNPDQPMIALTFDDGPSQHTWTITAALAAVDGRATFFVVGNRVATHHAALQQILAIGGEIGNHTYSHPSLTKLSQEKIRTQVQTTDDLLMEAVEITPTLLRPPYGSVNEQVLATVNKPFILWSVDTRDWQYRDKDYVVNYVLNNVQDGDIVLMHDIHETTAQACQEIIPRLTEMGYQLVTVSELFAAKNVTLQPGQVYRGRTFTTE